MLLRVSQVALQLAVSKQTVYRLCEEGKLTHSRIGSGRGTIRIKQSDVDLYLRGAQVQPAGSLYD